MVEAYEALKVSQHAGGNTLASMGILKNASYTVNDDTNNKSNGQFCIGQDFESYSGKSDALLSAISTLGSDLYHSGNYTSASFNDSAVFDFYLHYDMKLIIQDGALTVNI